MAGASGAVDVDRAVLIVIDVQNGFINQHTEHLPPAIAALAGRWRAAGRPVVLTRYLNHPGSPFERHLDWTRLQSAPETDIVSALAPLVPDAHAVIDKPGYTCFTPAADALITAAGWTDLVFCGIATDSCVLKSAVDAFERGHTVRVLTDACASDAGPAVHAAGLVVARRLIGATGLITTPDLLARLPEPGGHPGG